MQKRSIASSARGVHRRNHFFVFKRVRCFEKNKKLIIICEDVILAFGGCFCCYFLSFADKFGFRSGLFQFGEYLKDFFPSFDFNSRNFPVLCLFFFQRVAPCCDKNPGDFNFFEHFSKLHTYFHTC